MQLESLPFEAEAGLRKALEDSVFKEKDQAIIEAYPYVSDWQTKYLILHHEFSNDAITDEYTEEFNELTTLNSYKRKGVRGFEYLLKTVPTEKVYDLFPNDSSIRWFYISHDQQFDADVIKEFNEIEDILSFTDFSLAD